MDRPKDEPPSGRLRRKPGSGFALLHRPVVHGVHEDRFDLRTFHDHVLGAGAVSLTVLGKQIDLWVKSVP